MRAQTRGRPLDQWLLTVATVLSTQTRCHMAVRRVVSVVRVRARGEVRVTDTHRTHTHTCTCEMSGLQQRKGKGNAHANGGTGPADPSPPSPPQQHATLPAEKTKGGSIDPGASVGKRAAHTLLHTPLTLACLHTHSPKPQGLGLSST